MEKVKQVEFSIIAKYRPDDKAEVHISEGFFQVHKVDAPFEFWMMACEYFMHKTAQKSGAGYERAMELLMKGAMTYKTISTPHKEDNDKT